jgi:hypothetical protein
MFNTLFASSFTKKDYIPPVITLNGEANITLTQGDIYEGGFEMNVVHSHGTHGGRKWFIRLFY